jgi:alkylation response protein AidB-like acyl-CoA dehydrogenase
MEEEQRRLAEELLFTEVKPRSFAKKLYFGVFDASNVMPYPRVSEEEQQRITELLDKLARFADEKIDPDAIDRQAKIPDDVIRGLGQLGVLGISIPKENGGLGMTQHAYCRAVELLSPRCGSTALFVNAHQSVGLKALLLFGTPAQRARWLPALAKGEQIAAFSLTEPNAGSDANGVETRAVFDPETNTYILNGNKQWTTNGGIASVLTVMAQTEMDTPQGRQNRVTAFLVTPDMPGFSVTNPALEKVGMRGTQTANLAFHDMRVPAENILGPLGGGLKVCLTVLDYGRTTFGATCTGAAKFLLARAVKHARSRYQFKRPLASFALVKKKLATIAALTYAMDATTYLTAGLVDNGTEDFMLEAAMLKVFASDSLWTIIYETMQIFGGRSFFTDEPFERMMRDARLNMIGEGANEVLRAFIGLVGMRDVGVDLKGVLDALCNPLTSYDTLWRFGKQSMYRWKASTVKVNSPLIQDEAAQLSKAIRYFGFSVVRVLARYREDVIEKQLDLDRIATSAIAIYTTTAVLSKLDSDLTRVNGNANALGNDVAVAKLYCRQAMAAVKESLKSLFNDNDILIEAIADKL